LALAGPVQSSGGRRRPVIDGEAGGLTWADEQSRRQGSRRPAAVSAPPGRSACAADRMGCHRGSSRRRGRLRGGGDDQPGRSNSLGYADHQQAPADEMFAASARIARAVDVPVTVDAEAGYDLAPEQLVGRLIDCGAHGFNIEDTDHRAGSLLEPSVQADRIGELRGVIDASDVPLVLNARVDVFVGVTDPEAQSERVAAAVDRARRYVDAGADASTPSWSALRRLSTRSWTLWTAPW